ncbi:IS110 family transposase [Abyssisolibacter fermentans]|uniref:IS110 family transposase n=1 Tax=Abyssisolibacter fermentans TaxID=1766203 RepID=UPI00082E8F5A|nr:IS110 family transposase [Abyssisolibacter fermentans]
MEDILEICAGLDVHQKNIVACVLDGTLNKRPKKEIKSFGTETEELLKLLDWLEEKKCSHVAMESTGVYWKPVWNILETGNFELILANAHQIKNLPGRKTDVKDAEWIASLFRSGLVNKSFVPEQPIRDLRDLTRYRKKIIFSINREKNRVHKLLQDCNIKITSQLSDIFGDTGRQIIDHIMNNRHIGRNEIEEMVKGRGKGKIKTKVDDILKSVNGNVREHHRVMIRFSYEHVEFLENKQKEIEKLIDKLVQPYTKEIEILNTIPGVSKNSASIIIAEIGVNMEQFPTDHHLSSWAGLSPGNNESAGKKKEAKLCREINI